ncbi:MAG TPA: RNA 2',3'-cyclic phosphodiesterase [Alphaproteobacteria bacterium]|nr:RNA 2',3'-cyclic phosphodiesterase [Alphaproteobacteria bacterium]
MRLFVGIGIPPEIRTRLKLITGGVPGARWTEPDSYHLTLRFIGEADRPTGERIDVMLSELSAPAFDLELQGVGQFGSGRNSRALWVGVASSPALAHLARKVDRAVVAADLPPDDRNFTPHVTIARLRDSPIDRIMRFLSENSLFRAPAFTVDRFTLFESRTGKERAVYVPLADYPLALG